MLLPWTHTRSYHRRASRRQSSRETKESQQLALTLWGHLFARFPRRFQGRFERICRIFQAKFAMWSSAVCLQSKSLSSLKRRPWKWTWLSKLDLLQLWMEWTKSGSMADWWCQLRPPHPRQWSQRKLTSHTLSTSSRLHRSHSSNHLRKSANALGRYRIWKMLEWISWSLISMAWCLRYLNTTHSVSSRASK